MHTSLPSYRKIKESHRDLSLNTFYSFLKSPVCRRTLSLLLVIPVFLLIFFLGFYASPTTRNPISFTAYSSLRNISSHKWDSYAFALKTGKSVAVKRTPIQLMTFLKDVKNVLMIGDGKGVWVGDVEMMDVVGDSVEEYGHDKAPEMMHDQVHGHLQRRWAEQVIPDQSSRGWKDDAKKNIPGFKLLFEKFPAVDWYIMIDDDSYIFLDNLKPVLDRLDPALDHYLGAPTNFIGCDGVKKWGDSIYFAHGGSGIVLSRGALTKMVKGIDGCLKNYEKCWAGDIRTGLCLRDVGIPVKSAGYFSPDAPNDRFNFSFPCAHPRSFHHLLPVQIQTLYQLEQVARSQGQNVLLEDIFKAFLTDESKIDWDRPGGDYGHQGTSNGEDCKRLCKGDGRCVAYTFEGGMCYLKDCAPPIKKRPTGAITGLSVSRDLVNIIMSSLGRTAIAQRLIRAEFSHIFVMGSSKYDEYYRKRRRTPVFRALSALFFIILLGSIMVLQGVLSDTAVPHPIVAGKTSYANTTKNWDKFAFAVKTGSDIVHHRTPILFLTFLAQIKNKILIGEVPNIVIGDVAMVDVYTHLYDGLVGEDGRELRFDPAHKPRTEPSELNITQLVPNEDSQGWLSDAHKNLPGFQELFKKYPDSEWYFMIDDDTFVFMENLDIFVSGFNSSEAWYFGAGNAFVGCDEVNDYGHSTMFAHGGSGILISRGAMLRLQEIWEFCIIRYHDCWAGDVRLGLCLRNVGVYITNVKSFHTNPPNDNTVFGFACARPITFHHLLVDQIQRLYEMEMQSIKDGELVTMGTLMKEWVSTESRPDTTRRGDEYYSVAAPDLKSCIAICSASPRCVVYEFTGIACTLKWKVNVLEKRVGTTSGVMHSNFNCDPSNDAESSAAMLGL